MKKSSLLALAVTVVLINVGHSQAQVSLVKDINTSPAGLRAVNDYTDVFCNCGDYLFFPATTDKGKELWRTDGTANGTIMVKDLVPGIDEGLWSDIGCIGNGTVLFLGYDAMHGNEIWASDGTGNGTRLVKDITPGAGGVRVSILGTLGGFIFFVTDNDMNGEMEIWKSDGTEANTTMVAILGNYLRTSKTASSDTHLFFIATNLTSGEEEFWALNGLTGNIQKLLEGKTINAYQSVGNKIMFAVNDPVEKYSLWSSDGTPGGTVKVKHFGIPMLQKFLQFNNKLIFTVFGDTWISDGTEIGTVELTGGHTDAGVVAGNYFYGFGYDYSVASTRLFKTDGITVDITYLDGDPSEASMRHTIPMVNNKLILQHYGTDTGTELGVLDATSQTYSLLKDIKPGAENSEPRSWGVFKDRAYFFADDGVNGHEIWFTDGTEGGTSLLKNIATGTASAFDRRPSVFISNGKLQLIATSHGETIVAADLFSSDGTNAGTNFKFDFEPGIAAMFGSTATDLIYFNASKLYKTNGSTESVTLIKDLTNEIISASFQHKTYHRLGDKLIFPMSISSMTGSKGNEFWVTDGTEAGTQILKDINPAGASGVSGNGVVLGSKLIFDGSTPTEGSELWSTDGTESGTALLKDINPGASHSQPMNFAMFKNKVFFTASESDHGNEVWLSDGTPEGTVLLADLVPGATGSDARGLTVVSDHLLFIAYDAERGWCLWKTDGTTEGTVFVKDIESGNEKNYGPTNFVSSGGKFYFTASDAAYGTEMWVSDGTASGTHVIDRIPGPYGTNPSVLTPVNGLVYFRSQGAFWRTNGTATGTVKVSDLEPVEIVYFNNWIYFTAPHPDYGQELFKVEFTKLEQQITLKPTDAKVMGDAPFVIEATASSGLPVTIASEEEVSLVGVTATLVKPGTVKITVQQPGDALFNPAPPVSQTFCVLPAKPVITSSANASGDPVLASSSATGNQWFRQEEPLTGATEKIFQPAENDNYKVQVTIDGCTSDFSDAFYAIVTGVEEVHNNITFYPNPASDMVYIKADDDGSALLNIIDLQGKKLSTHQLQANDLVEQSLSGYPKGVYLIQLVQKTGTSYMKLVKQ